MRLRLHYRIVLPFAVIAIVATAIVAFVAIRVTSQTITAHLRDDVSRAAVVISRSGLPMNQAVLGTVREITGADIMLIGPAGVEASTLDPADQAAAARLLIAEIDRKPALEGTTVAEEIGPYFAAYASVSGRISSVLVVMRRTDEADMAAAALRNTIAAATLFVLLLAISVAGLVARRVTGPIERLGEFARSASLAARTRHRADTGPDEVGRLGVAFNEMLTRLDHAQAALVRSEKLGLAGFFAARVAHDVRNPLSSIRMQAQILRDTSPADSESFQSAEAILHDAAQVEFVVKDLLELARPSDLHRAPVDLNAVVQSVIRQIEPQCRHRHLSLKTEFASHLPRLWLDGPRLTHALLNLAMNAMDAVKDGGTVMVCTSLDASAGLAFVDVDDNGSGLAPGVADRLFDPFVSTKPGGVGLGLINAKAAIESHGGTIAILPRTPAGTRAHVTLPLGAPAPDHG